MTLPSQPRTYDDILNNLIARVRTLEALPTAPATGVAARWQGARSSGDPVTSPTSDTGEALELNSRFDTNAPTVFGTGTTTDATVAPTNDPADTYMLILSPGFYVWTAQFRTTNPSAVSPWPDQTTPWVDMNIITSYREMWALPNQSGFPTDWTSISQLPPSPPVFLESAPVGDPTVWQNDAFIRFSGHGIITTDMIETDLEWGWLQMLLINQSGGDVGITYDLQISGIALGSVSRMRNVY